MPIQYRVFINTTDHTISVKFDKRFYDDFDEDDGDNDDDDDDDDDNINLQP